MQAIQKMDFMTKQESYAERRQLFKNIWHTAMNIDEKDDIMNKPKVIKTLRLDEVDKCIAGKKKKQRIKNLRHVCNKILDFCDKQDADDIFYEQMAAEGQEPPHHQKIESQSPKPKITRVKKKVKKAKSMFTPLHGLAKAKPTTSERKDEFIRSAVTKTSRNTSPIKVKETMYAKNSNTLKVKPKSSPKNIRAIANNQLGDAKQATTKPKILRKKRSKRKKSDSNVPQSAIDWPDP